MFKKVAKPSPCWTWNYGPAIWPQEKKKTTTFYYVMFVLALSLEKCLLKSCISWKHQVRTDEVFGADHHCQEVHTRDEKHQQTRHWYSADAKAENVPVVPEDVFYNSVPNWARGGTVKLNFARTIKGRSKAEGEKQRVISHLSQGTLKGISNRRSNFSSPVLSGAATKTTDLQKQMISCLINKTFPQSSLATERDWRTVLFLFLAPQVH